MPRVIPKISQPCFMLGGAELFKQYAKPSVCWFSSLTISMFRIALGKKNDQVNQVSFSVKIRNLPFPSISFSVFFLQTLGSTRL